jgi:hypothetical protein
MSRSLRASAEPPVMSVPCGVGKCLGKPIN